MPTTALMCDQLTTWCVDRTPVRFGRHRNTWLITDIKPCPDHCAGVVTLVCSASGWRISGHHAHDDIREAS